MKKHLIIYLFLFFQGSILLGQSLHYTNKDLPCLNKQYQLYAHFIYDSLRTTHSEVDLQNAIETANRMFEPICISFELCDTDTVFNYNFNIIVPEEEMTELSTEYVAQKRINLYLLTDTLVGPTTAGICAGNVGSLNNGNIFLKSLGSLTHELGHFFGLLHTFEGNGEELVDGSNCETAGDGICDTPADPYNPDHKVDEYVKDCIFYKDIKDANGDYYQPQVGNIMSYYPCRCGFTREQYLRMAQNYLNANKKHW
jgi:hypothetical protein